jgi:hypothetical protein
MDWLIYSSQFDGRDPACAGVIWHMLAAGIFDVEGAIWDNESWASVDR